MMFLSLFVGVVSLLSLGVCEGSASQDRVVLQASFPDLPTCGYECMVPALTNIECDLANTTDLSECLCSSVQAQKTVAECLTVTCNAIDLYQVTMSTQALCQNQPHPTRQPEILATTITLAVAIIIFVVARCWSRYFVSKRLWWDDWLLLMAAALLLTMHGITIWGTLEGYGQHIWTVSPSKYETLFTFMWTYEILYTLVQMFTKLAILLLYYRIFSQSWLQRTVIGCGIFVILQGIAYTSTIIFLCTPVAFSYNKQLEGTCGNPLPLILSGAIATLVEDVGIIILPIPSILKLSLRREKKIGIVVILCIGFIAVIASMVRLKYVVHFSMGVDENWDYFGITITSSIELSLSMICVCIPACKLLLARSLPNYFGSDGGGCNRTLSLETYVETTQRYGSEAKLKSKPSTIGNLDQGSSLGLHDVERAGPTMVESCMDDHSVTTVSEVDGLVHVSNKKMHETEGWTRSV